VALAPLAIWIYMLTFAFSSLWFAHYCLQTLQGLREAEPLAPVVPALTSSPTFAARNCPVNPDDAPFARRKHWRSDQGEGVMHTLVCPSMQPPVHTGLPSWSSELAPLGTFEQKTLPSALSTQ
jgi:hypothetical protein